MRPMSEMVSRWPVLISPSLEPDDVDNDGRLTLAGAERLAAEARDAYIGSCRTLDGAAIEVERSKVVIGRASVEDGVTVSTAATELFPDSFVMSTRIRPAGGPSGPLSGRRGPVVAADVTTTVGIGGGLGTDVRDEMISLAHSASHYH